jgi:hypothetical protein
MARKAKNVGRCTYCGRWGEITKDHIPPRALFGSAPSNLIKVPSCKKCNQGASRDDEYFRLILTMRTDVFDHPDVQQVIPKVMTSLERPEARAFAESFLRNTYEIPLYSRGGVFLGKTGGYNLERERLSRVAERIIKGLFFHKTRCRLTAKVTAWEKTGLKNVAEAQQERLRQLCAAVQSSPPEVIGNNVFHFWYKQSSENPQCSAWVLIFYERIGFIGLSTPIPN